jgi:hypothetical protein
MIASAVYLVGPSLGKELCRNHSTPIKTSSELEVILKEEKEKLGLTDATKIHAELREDKKHRSYARRINTNEYQIILSSNGGHNILILRHELYHIADGHCDHKPRKSLNDKLNWEIKYRLIYEPQADLYALTGIKL